MNETSSNNDREQQQQAKKFEREAAGPQVGLVREFLDFLRENKKWWLVPVVVVLLLLGFLVVLANLGLTPFIYMGF